MKPCATILSAFWLCVLALPAEAQLATPSIAVDSPFAVRGGSLTFTVTGTPGATYQLFSSKTPAEIARGTAGLQFYKSGTQTQIGSGTFAANGVATQAITIPTTATLGAIFYVQVVAKQAAVTRFGNSVPYRIAVALPSGTRETTAVAVTPNGQRAYVGHNEGGVISVLDAAADTKLAELPVTVGTGGVPHRPLRIAVDPEGRHAFVSNTFASTLTVIHTATGSIAAQIAMPRGNRGIGFAFGATRRIYVANETTNTVQVLEEAPLGTFTLLAPIPLQGRAPGSLLILPNGVIAVANRTAAEIEFLDPTAAPGFTTVARTPTLGLPHDLAWNNGEILIPSFVPTGAPGVEGVNRVLRLDPATFQITGGFYDDVGTDYRRAVVDGNLVAIAGAGTGTVVFGDTVTLTQIDNTELAPGEPTATPQDIAFVRDGNGVPVKLYVTDYFRETVRPILLAGGPAFALGGEIALSWSGQILVPLSGAHSSADDGEWFFRSVNLFGGGAFNPNRVTCDSCHVEGAGDNLLLRHRQVPPAWGLVDTKPYGWSGNSPTLAGIAGGAINHHNHTGLPTPIGADQMVLDYFADHQPPASIYRNANGSMTAAQQAGRAIFQGAGQCTTCHAAPLFIPPSGSPRTIAAGIGSGLAPANVPSLRGIWATAPYLHDGAAATLLDVLTLNPLDTHGALGAGLTPAEREQLVEYLKSL